MSGLGGLEGGDFMGKKAALKTGGTGSKAGAIEWPLTRHAVQTMAEMFAQGGKLDASVAEKIVVKAKTHLREAATVVDLSVSMAKGATVAVVGDTHGQVHDVIHILKTFGLPTKDRRYIFNGDFVDRGDYGCEVLLLVCGWLICDPSSIVMLRGNHEDRTITGAYGFEEECRRKYGQGMYNLFVELFAALPLACVIDERVLVLHGGLFRDPNNQCELAPLSMLREITSEERSKFDSLPDEHLMTDVLWSDPTPSDQATVLGENNVRGSGCHFNDIMAIAWLDKESLDLLVRGHEGPDLQDLSDGYATRADDRVVTVFSARNYLGRHNNMGCIAVFGRDLYPKFMSY